FFPPAVAMHVVKIACQRPDTAGRSLSQWDCAEIVRVLVADDIVKRISPERVRQILADHRLKPWRFKMWLSSKVPRDEVFAAQVRHICDLYTRPLEPHEIVLCVDERPVSSRGPDCRRPWPPNRISRLAWSMNTSGKGP